MKLRREARTLKLKALSSLRRAVTAFNGCDEDGRVTCVLLHLQHVGEMLLKAILVQRGVRDVKPFTFIGATTRAGLLSSPLRSRFGIVLRLEFYTHEDLRIIVERSAEILGVEVDDAGALEIASRSRGTPRIANRLLRRVRDYAQVRGAGKIDLPTAQAALQMLEVDRHGFDEVDRKLLLTIIEKYQGGPVGVNTLAAALAEEQDAIEEIYEPFLIQIGFLNRTPRGRVATQLAYEHFGITPNRKQSSLF